MKGILNSFCRISATLTLCLGVCAAFAEQTPNPRSAVASKVASKRSETKVVSRGDGQTGRVSAVVSRGGNVSARSGNVSKARAATNGSKTSLVRSAIKNVVNSNRTGASVARSGTVVKSNVARSGVKAGAAKQARSAASKVSMSGLARAASTARATAVFNDISKIGGGYSQCRDAYATCMDQFCANANDTFRRCFCSSRFTEFRNTEETLDEVKVLLQRFEDNNLNAVDKTAAEVNAMYTATVGEAAIKNDVSGAQSVLNEIGDLLSGKPRKKETAEPAGLMNVSFDLDMDNLWGSENSLFDTGSARSEDKLAQLEGMELYSASNKQCLEVIKDSCQSDAMLNMATSAYNIMITQDCNLYEKKIESQKKAVEDTVRQAEKYLREARLEEYRSHNSADVNECINNVKKALTQDMACGENYRRCLDFSGLYINQTTGEPIYSTNLHKLVDVIKLDGSYDVLGANKDFDAGLETKKTFAATALDSCRDIADTVWVEFKRTALIEIAQAQDEMLEEVKSSCVETMAECYDANTGSLKKMDTTTAQASGAIAVAAARTMCRDKVSACAALYGNGQCDIDTNGKITNALQCGVSALLTFVDTVDAVKMTEGCATALSKYVTEELCAPLESEKNQKEPKAYPWGCRNKIVRDKDLNGSGEQTLESLIGSKSAVYCPTDVVNVNDGQNATALKGEIESVVGNLLNTLKSELNYMYDNECTNVDGIWTEMENIEDSEYLNTRNRGEEHQEAFYTALTGRAYSEENAAGINSLGVCLKNSIKFQCERQDAVVGSGDAKSLATYDSVNDICNFTPQWDQAKCTVQLGGYYEDGQCYFVNPADLSKFPWSDEPSPDVDGADNDPSPDVDGVPKVGGAAVTTYDAGSTQPTL